MHPKHLLIAGSSLLAGALFAASTTAATTPKSVTVSSKTYYVVTSTDSALNTGNEVCAAVGRSCVGYTTRNNDACKSVHPTAKTLTSVNGSKSGFYCDGAPQKGLACEKTANTCQVCPNCNVNLDCTTDLTSMNQFREAYVECGPMVAKSSSSRRAVVRASSKKATTAADRRALRLGKKAYGAPAATKTSDVGSYPGKKVCEFYNPGTTSVTVSNKKLVSCGAPRAADNFCITVMQNRLAKSEKCEDNGVVICSLPCTAQGAGNLVRCAADINRKRGVNAAPLDFCAKASSSAATATKKKAGDTCNHGGDCQSGICLGTGRPYNQNYYQCSCSQTKLDTSCNK